MKNILLDTCILIHIIRQSDIGKRCVEALKNFDSNANLVISVVTKAELASFAKQMNWGKNKKLDKLNQIFAQIIYTDILSNDWLLMDAYTNIDAFSKRKIPDDKGNLLKGGARKMGKNDPWIAATAYALDIPLMTADGDFDHLNGTFINVMKVV